MVGAGVFIVKSLVGIKNLAQNVCAKSASRCRTGQNIRIQEDLHDTSANTSSSVR